AVPSAFSSATSRPALAGALPAGGGAGRTVPLRAPWAVPLPALLLADRGVIVYGIAGCATPQARFEPFGLAAFLARLTPLAPACRSRRRFAPAATALATDSDSCAEGKLRVDSVSTGVAPTTDSMRAEPAAQSSIPRFAPSARRSLTVAIRPLPERS